MKPRLRQVLQVSLTVVLLALSGQFKVPVPGVEVPITLQSMVVILLPLIFDWKNSTAGVALFLVLAAVGAPILAGGAGGLQQMGGTSFGFLSAFLLVNFLTGLFLRLSFHPKWLFLITLFLIQHSIIMACGLAWIQFTSTGDVTWDAYVAPFLPGLIVKSALGTLLAEAYLKLVRKAVV